MAWLQSAIIASFVGALALALVFAYLYISENRDYLKVWATAWAIAALYYPMEIALRNSPTDSLFLVILQSTALASSGLIIWGVYLFLNRKIDFFIIAIIALLTLWIGLTALLGLFFAAAVLPIFIFWGAVLISMGWTLFQNSRIDRLGKILTFSTLIILGLMTALYPAFHQEMIWTTARYSFIALMELLLAGSMLVVFLQQSWTALVENAEHVPPLLRMAEFSVPDMGMAENAKRFHLFVEKSKDFVYLFNYQPELQLTYVNPAYANASGYSPEEFYQNPALSLSHILPEDQKIFQMMKDKWPDHAVIVRWLDKYNSLVWTEQWLSPVIDDQGNTLFMMGIGHPISEPEIIPAADHIAPAESASPPETYPQPGSAAAAFFPDRHYFQGMLTETIKNAKSSGQKLAVLYLDLDKIKQVSKRLGHDACEQFVLSCTNRIQSVLDDSQILAHGDSDEFLILIPDILSYLDVEMITGKIIKVLEQPESIDLYQFPVSPRIGIAIYPMHGKSAAELIHNAELAVLPSKKNPAAKYNRYDPGLQREVDDKVRLEEDLRQAFARKEFSLDYQAQFSLAPKRRIAGAEALLRWHHPVKGLLLPETFLAVAEETELINQLGEWVLETACQQNKRWQQSGYPEFPVAVNISASQFRQGNFVDTVQSALHRASLHPDFLILEIKGATAFENITFTQDKLRRLRNIGIQVALDNFGSSALILRQLKDITVKKIKIDRAFLKDIYSTSHMEEILSIIISLGKQLGLATLAEGVENQRQLDLLTHFGCLQAQGNFLAQPTSGEDFEIRFLINRRSPA